MATEVVVATVLPPLEQPDDEKLTAEEYESYLYMCSLATLDSLREKGLLGTHAPTPAPTPTEDVVMGQEDDEETIYADDPADAAVWEEARQDDDVRELPELYIPPPPPAPWGFTSLPAGDQPFYPIDLTSDE